MKNQLLRTNALRILEAEGVAHRAVSYEVDLQDLSGLHAAQELGVDPKLIYKTLCLLPDGRKRDFILVSLPSDSEVSMKKAAALCGAKSCEMAPLKDLFALTGYQRGGCSPLGIKGRHRFFLDFSARDKTEIAVSAGARGLQVWLAPEDLLRLTEGQWGDVTR